MSDTKKLAHAIWQCKYHTVWCPKYRFRIWYTLKYIQFSRVVISRNNQCYQYIVIFLVHIFWFNTIVSFRLLHMHRGKPLQQVLQDKMALFQCSPVKLHPWCVIKSRFHRKSEPFEIRSFEIIPINISLSLRVKCVFSPFPATIFKLLRVKYIVESLSPHGATIVKVLFGISKQNLNFILNFALTELFL